MEIHVLPKVNKIPRKLLMICPASTGGYVPLRELDYKPYMYIYIYIYIYNYIYIYIYREILYRTRV